MFHPGGPSFAELMRQALSSTDEGYDLLAPKFDKTPFRTPDRLLEAMEPFFRAAPVTRALDVCCGTGAATEVVRRIASESVVGVDRSEGMLREAARRAAEHDGDGTPRAPVTFLRADALALPFDGDFDLAVSFGAFGHILEEDEARFVQSVARALAPGGRFVFATSTMPPVTSAAWWLARGFNAAMRVRNALLRPPFIMYYLTFLWPNVRAVLEDAGFSVRAEPLALRLGSFSPEQRRVVAVVAEKR